MHAYVRVHIHTHTRIYFKNCLNGPLQKVNSPSEVGLKMRVWVKIRSWGKRIVLGQAKQSFLLIELKCLVYF